VAKTFLMRVSFFLLLFPAFVSAAALDDYYLQRLAPGKIGARTLSSVVAGKSIHVDRCQTGIRHDVRMNWKKLQSATQETLAKVLMKPSLLGERTCTPVGGHFTVHYATTGIDALEDLTDVNKNGVPDWVETVAGVFEYVYDVEVNKMGYRPPPNSKYDVYLTNLAASSSPAYGLTQSLDIGATPVSYQSYIVIDKSFTSSIFVNAQGGPYSPLTSLRITAAHEFHHAIQFGYNAYFETSFAEMTSTWIEDEVYDSGNQLYSYIQYYLPGSLSLNAVGNGRSEYGRWIFNRYVSEIQGSRSVILSVWDEVGKKPVPENANSPDDGIEIPMLPLVDTVLLGNLNSHFFGFAKRLLTQDWLSHQVDISFIPIIPIPLSNTFSVSGAFAVSNISLPTPYTFTSYKYIPASIDGLDLVIELPNLSSDLAVAAFKKDDFGWHEYAYNAGSQNIRVATFTPDAVVYLLICNNGGDTGNPVAVFPAIPADSSLVADGTGLGSDGLVLDANRLAIPQQDQLPPVDKSVGGGGCFIATAAYGSYLHPKVAELRSFRDRYLLSNAPGRLFVSLYYRLSPPVAQVIAEHEWMKGSVRLLLLPLLLAVEHPGGALLVLIMFGGGAVFGLARRRKSIYPAAVSSGVAH